MSYRGRLRGYDSPYARPSVPRASTRSERNHFYDLQVELDRRNSSQSMSTYDDSTGGWVPWVRPYRQYKNGTMSDVAASGFHRVEPYDHPICPHTHLIKKHREMQVHLNQPYRMNRHVDFFRATSHVCRFTVVIPRLNEPLVTQDPVMVAEQLSMADDEEAEAAREQLSYDQDHLLAPFFAPDSEDEVTQLLALQSQSLPTPPSSASKTVDKYQKYLRDVLINPRVSPLMYLDAQNRETNVIPYCSPGHSPKPYFRDSVAEARANSDEALISEVQRKQSLMVYYDDPGQHPAADLVHTHPVLEPYDERLYPDCLNTIFQHLQYLYTNLGRAIRELNSTLGIPVVALLVLRSSAVTCSACSSNEHVNLRVVDLDHVSEFPLRTFAKRPSDSAEFTDAPIGAAFLAWNSRIGVPQDVWAVISTAFIRCRTCLLCRSFNGDAAHRDADGSCMDPGEESCYRIATGSEDDEDAS
ncbi:hypothetical protein H0H92_015741 [Tricholoma furcatifolium]|nr:hypothetical protein H0H92_015741 [Tricholoma furcatifolium]